MKGSSRCVCTELACLPLGLSLPVRLNAFFVSMASELLMPGFS